jgi:hypothetical protein
MTEIVTASVAKRRTRSPDARGKFPERDEVHQRRENRRGGFCNDQI